MSKRLFDLVIVVAAIVPLALLCLMVAILVKSTSVGPVFYWSKRIGIKERVFLMPKFRTMRTDTPEVATHLLTDPNKWLTPVGSFLRKSSLDELPQFFSVLIGDMSLVGPRPALHNQHDLIAARRAHGIDVLRPGITGWAQVNGRDEIPIPDKVAFDTQYLKRRSISFDLEILFRTAINVIHSKGISH